jgi:hypothetical protein
MASLFSSPEYLSAETVKFFLAAARYFRSFLNFQLFSLHTDPLLTLTVSQAALDSSSLAADFSTAHHLACWLETVFMTLDGDDRDNLLFTKHFTNALQRQEADPPISLKKEKYQDVLGENMAGMLKPVCSFYIKHLQMQRNYIAKEGKISSQELNNIDNVINQLSEILASNKFKGVEPYKFSIPENNAS